MAYVLVQFDDSEDGSIATVHKSWLTPRKKEVYWPPYKNQTLYDKAVLKGEPVDFVNWSLYKISRIFSAYDDLTEAKQKERLAEITSDLEKDVEIPITNRKRPTKRPLRFLDSSDDDDESTIIDSNLVRPPLIVCQDQDVNSFDQFTSSQQQQALSNTNTISTDLEQSNFNIIQLPGAKKQQLYSCPNTPSSTSSTSILSNTPSTINDTLTKDSAFQNKLISYLSLIVEQNKEILTIVKNTCTPGSICNIARPTLPIQLPVDTLQNFEIFNEHLQNVEQEKELCLYLSTLDRTNVMSATNSSLKYCMTYKLAKEFSYLGSRNSKKSFAAYPLKKTIVAAIKIAIPSSDERKIEDYIKVWLRRSTKSYILEQEKKNKQYGIQNESRLFAGK